MKGLDATLALSLVFALAGCGGGGPSGSYVHDHGDGTWQLEFQDADTVVLTMSAEGTVFDSSTCDYALEGARR